VLELASKGGLTTDQAEALSDLVANVIRAAASGA